MDAPTVRPCTIITEIQGSLGSGVIGRIAGTGTENRTFKYVSSRQSAPFHSLPRTITTIPALCLRISATAVPLFISLSVATITADGSAFFMHDPFAVYVAEHLPANIVLGSDWVVLCQAAASKGDIIFAPETHEATFNRKTLTISSMSRGDIVGPSSLVPRGWPSAVASTEVSTVPSVEVPVLQASALQNELDPPPALQGKSPEEILSMNPTQPLDDPDPFVKLSILEKTAVMHFLVVLSNSNVRVLKDIPAHS
ncbi:hypothetical protein K438DRAFT_1751304 [Mycena galopus ATCC 62051]|nr:hypothetical protein K438DRAFT_1751304 [Mycena galopus ATCC 62051]